MTAIYTTGGMSGGHLNPAISISLSVFRGFPARRCVIYIAAQLLGAITAGGISYAVYHDAIVEVATLAKVPQNASVAAQALITLPKPFVHPATAFFTEFLGSAILVGSILALGDDTNAPPGAGMQAFIIGILITIVVLALGYNTGGYVFSLLIPNAPQGLKLIMGLFVVVSTALETSARELLLSWLDGVGISSENTMHGGFGVHGSQTSLVLCLVP